MGRSELRKALNDGPERRLVTFDASAVSRRDGDEDGEGSILFEGHAAVFNSRTYIGPPRYGFYEEIARGAFDDVLEDDVRFLVNHDPNLLLARTTSGTLQLSVDKRGLLTEAEIAPTQLGRDTALLLERGDLSGMSFAFTVAEDEWTDLEDEDGNRVGELRIIKRFGQLYDVGPVTYPAYPDTDASLRAASFDLLVAKLGDERVRELLGDADESTTADGLTVVQRHRHRANAEKLRA